MHSRHMLTDAFGLVAAPGRPGDRPASPLPNIQTLMLQQQQQQQQQQQRQRHLCSQYR
jgi:hypothetical protein